MRILRTRGSADSKTLSSRLQEEMKGPQNSHRICPTNPSCVQVRFSIYSIVAVQYITSWLAKNRTICQTTASGLRLEVALVCCQILSPARKSLAYRDSKMGSECGIDSIKRSAGS